MKTVTYHGPCDRARLADGRTIRRGEPSLVPNDLAEKAKRRCGDRLTVHDQPAASGQEDDA